jgi:hypothetical protein
MQSSVETRADSPGKSRYLFRILNAIHLPVPSEHRPSAVREVYPAAWFALWLWEHRVGMATAEKTFRKEVTSEVEKGKTAGPSEMGMCERWATLPARRVDGERARDNESWWWCGCGPAQTEESLARQTDISCAQLPTTAKASWHAVCFCLATSARPIVSNRVLVHCPVLCGERILIAVQHARVEEDANTILTVAVPPLFFFSWLSPEEIALGRARGVDSNSCISFHIITVDPLLQRDATECHSKYVIQEITGAYRPALT